MPVFLDRPKLEGTTIAVGEGRRIGFAEFGHPQGRAIIWLHGTPGGRRQIPLEARVFAEEANIRLIGVDRPGIGSSTAHDYANVVAFADDLRTFADTLGISRMAVVGLSGGGPYTLGCAAALPDRVVVVGVIGGVAPTVGPDAIAGGLMGDLGVRVAPVLQRAGNSIGLLASALIRLIRPVASPVVDVYGQVSPRADRQLLARPEIKAMFLDDILNGSRRQMAAPFSDIVVFARDWGFRLDQVTIPVRWWHGDADHIVPYAHGEHVVSRLSDAELVPMPGESHLAGLGRAKEILSTMLHVWDEHDRDGVRGCPTLPLPQPHVGANGDSRE